MSAFGTKRTFPSFPSVSAFGGKADIERRGSCYPSCGKRCLSVGDRGDGLFATVRFAQPNLSSPFARALGSGFPKHPLHKIACIAQRHGLSDVSTLPINLHFRGEERTLRDVRVVSGMRAIAEVETWSEIQIFDSRNSNVRRSGSPR